MDVLALGIVFGGVIPEQPQVDEVRGGGEEFKRREVAFVEGARIGPYPADAIFFHEPDMLGPVPTVVTELDREPEIARQLGEKRTEQRSAWLRGERGRQLDQNDVKLRSQEFHCLEERGELSVAIAQEPFVRDRLR